MEGASLCIVELKTYRVREYIHLLKTWAGRTSLFWVEPGGGVVESSLIPSVQFISKFRVNFFLF